jgi:hypothetical protein
VGAVTSGGVLNSWCRLRRQPAKLRRRVRDHLSRPIAVGLPSQGGRCTEAKRDQETGEGERDSLAERRSLARESIIFQVIWAGTPRLV